MKKAYKKPSVYIEEYTLSANVALSPGSCGIGANSGSALGKPEFGSPESCAWNIGGISFFLVSNHCENPLQQPDDIGIGCYNSGAGSEQIFAS